MSWRLEGTYFENCNCEMVCPCTASGLSKPASYERCKVVMAFHVDSGEIEGVDVGGRTAIMVVDSPREMSEGNWKVGLIIDDGATEKQAAALGRVFSGELGGPPTIIAPLFGEMLGVKRQPVEYADEGRRHRVKAGNAIDIEIEDFVAPRYGDEGPISKLVGMAHPANSTLTIASATRSQVDAFGMQWDNTGKNGHSAPFSWVA
jgi:hypothetical protein